MVEQNNCLLALTSFSMVLQLLHFHVSTMTVIRISCGFKV